MNFLVFYLTASTNRAERRVVSGSTKAAKTTKPNHAPFEILSVPIALATYPASEPSASPGPQVAPAEPNTQASTDHPPSSLFPLPSSFSLSLPVPSLLLLPLSPPLYSSLLALPPLLFLALFLSLGPFLHVLHALLGPFCAERACGATTALRAFESAPKVRDAQI